MKALTTWGRRALGALVCALGAGAGVPVAHAADLVVGQVAPLSGVLASTGAQMVLGGKIYFDWVNANGGVHGTPIRQDVVDGGGRDGRGGRRRGGRRGLRSGRRRRDMFLVSPYFGRLAPYFERDCLRFLTPCVSRTPRST